MYQILYGGKQDKQATTVLYSFCQKLNTDSILDNSKTDELWETPYRMIKNLLKYKEMWFHKMINNQTQKSY